MAEERPAFTLETEPSARPVLPVVAWCLATFAAGAIAGGWLRATWCSPLVALCPRLGPVLYIVLALSALVAAVAWLILPIRDDREAGVRAAAVLAMAGGIAAAIPGFVEDHASLVAARAAALALGGLAAPAVMLAAVRPDASLELPGGRGRAPRQWLRIGAVPSASLFAGFAMSGLIAGPLLGAIALVAAGVVILLGASVPAGPDLAVARPPASRARMIVRMSPMLRHAFAADAGIAFAIASCAAAVVVAPLTFNQIEGVAAAAGLGGVLGALLFALLAPRIEEASGRGRLLAFALLCAALAPAALAASPRLDPVLVMAAAALAAFALSSAPLRGALLFDLATSRGRLRTAADLQAAKLAAAAAGPLCVVAVESAAPGLGLVVPSAVAFASLALFAPTLGSLGRRSR